MQNYFQEIRMSNTTVSIVLSRYSMFLPIVYTYIMIFIMDGNIPLICGRICIVLTHVMLVINVQRFIVYLTFPFRKKIYDTIFVLFYESEWNLFHWQFSRASIVRWQKVFFFFPFIYLLKTHTNSTTKQRKQYRQNSFWYEKYSTKYSQQTLPKASYGFSFVCS